MFVTFLLKGLSHETYRYYLQYWKGLYVRY
nr:MAG TPA: hypothetical protein [Caudoviricetes sp.]